MCKELKPKNVQFTRKHQLYVSYSEIYWRSKRQTERGEKRSESKELTKVLQERERDSKRHQNQYEQNEIKEERKVSKAAKQKDLSEKLAKNWSEKGGSLTQVQKIILRHRAPKRIRQWQL